ncbi:hypothetical protein J7F03_10120 [Streptomyces sp. ISL-43]|uniref:hypothetical protein n=1 Tax=Streptomyces sp. ISL-43 TaxID=2819183 RepID=UPI001BED3848|nr:hypothetical protein [Streptomyces sp. ISL-43]MBT2447424.1 hypothetical protein [Streptomyces sp. ISL-43]
MGSLACVRSPDELTIALVHIHEVLVPGGSLSFEYYASSVYRPLADQGTFTVPTPHHGGTTTFTVTLDDRDLLTMGTRVDEQGRPPVEFSEQVLLIGREQVENCLDAAGFTLGSFDPSEGLQPYDWYTTHRTT